MTIKLLTPRGAIPINAIITLDAATETALVADKVATTDLTGGTVWSGPVDRSTTPAEQAYARASAVSGAGNAVVVPAQPSVAGAVRQALARAANVGTLVADFVGTKWTTAGGGSTGGAPTIVTGYTGYDASGSRTGVVSRTGQAAMMRVTPTTTADSVSLAFGAINVPLNGRIGLWVHCANVTGYDTGAGPTAGRIRLDISTSAISVGNGARIGWSIEGQLREGWNFLKFVQRGNTFNNAANIQLGANVFTGAHPYGTEVSTLGTDRKSVV